ncbi:MAG: hypothetical protein R3C61_02625 [Bacteroidia bacterium]
MTKPINFSHLPPLPQVSERGKAIFREGRVREVESYGDVFIGQVSGDKMYKVCIDNRNASPTFTCTCPFDAVSPCKHVVSVIAAIESGQFVRKSAEFSPEMEVLTDLINIDQVRAAVAETKNPQPQIELLKQLTTSGNIRNAIRCFLGIYEGIGSTHSAETTEVVANIQDILITSVSIHTRRCEMQGKSWTFFSALG